MKRKQEDRLARLAFGDVSPSESTELEQLAAKDPEIARTLNEYRSMRDGLRELADVPAHQLSNERLKEAILGQGLKTKPNSTLDLSWLWMSAVACGAVAFLFVGLSRNRSVQPQMVGFDSVAVASKMPTPTTSFEHPFSSAVTPPAPTRDSAVKMVASLKTPTLNAHRSHHHRASNGFVNASLIAGILSDPMAEDATALTPQPAPVSTDTPSEPGSEAIAKLQPVDDKPDAGLVEIEADKDANGTQKANELGSTKNVVFGG